MLRPEVVVLERYTGIIFPTVFLLYTVTHVTKIIVYAQWQFLDNIETLLISATDVLLGRA
jgi:hypothetical protein